MQDIIIFLFEFLDFKYIDDSSYLNTNHNLLQTKIKSSTNCINIYQNCLSIQHILRIMVGKNI